MVHNLKKSMIKTGIIGGAGYTAGELIRLLINHPDVEITFIHSNSNAGNKITDVHTGLYGETDLMFTDRTALDEIDLLFFCTAHGDTRKFMESHPIPESLKIIDLSTDYRIAGEGNKFIYGLPELNREEIRNARYIANPGCFATGIQLALLPLAVHALLDHPIHVNAITGSTGAGVKHADTSHFSWRNNNVSIYKPFTHQHLEEIKQSLAQLQPDMHSEILFIPVRGNFTRGIFATLYTECRESQKDIEQLYQTYYKNHPFTFVVDKCPDLKQVINTNKCLLHLHKHEDMLLITSVTDNLLKGACGQAVHNMNLMFHLEETTGLKLKSSAF
jgi:N-acetyl-gamma-glutamyl-phosphate reductase